MVEVVGASAVVYEAPNRRSVINKKLDMPYRQAIYVGRSPIVSGGHRVSMIEWDAKRQCWSLWETLDRQYVQVDNTRYPLREVPAKGIDPKRFDQFVSRLSPKAMTPEVYVVEKIQGMRGKGKDIEYRVKWKGWSHKDNTWEPAAHLTDYGADEVVATWHASNPDEPDPYKVAASIMHIQMQDDDIQAVDALIKKHKLEGTKDG